MISLAKPSITDAEKQAVLTVLESGWLAQGAYVAKLEAQMAALHGARHAIATSSGTTALHATLLALGIGSGDEVITTPFTFGATANCLLMVGAVPVFVDIEPDTFNLDPRRVEAAVTPHTRAILPVHLYGHMCDMPVLREIADRHDLILIEDAAQAVGAACHGEPPGRSGTAIFSLYATKTITAGEGGIIVTDSDEVAAICRLLRNQGMKTRYDYQIIGYNYRMSDLHAALACAQLERIDAILARRRANAATISAGLRSVQPPCVLPGFEHGWHQFTVRIPSDRDGAATRLKEAGIEVGIYYPAPLTEYPHILAGSRIAGPLNQAQQAAREVLSLPVHDALSDAELQFIIDTVNSL